MTTAITENGNLPAVPLRAGDRVKCVSNGQVGIVEDREGGNVLLLWGVDNACRPVTAWRPVGDVVFQEHGEPYVATEKKA